MLLQKNTDNILKNEFYLPCSEIVIVRGDGEKAFRGSGFVEQTKRGVLKFSFIDKLQNQLPPQKIKGFIEGDTLKVGQLYDESFYFSVKFNDVDGRDWETSRIPESDIDFYFPSTGYVSVSGLIPELSSVSKSSREAKHLRLTYHLINKELKYPVNKKRITKSFVEGDEEYGGWNYNTADFNDDMFEFRLTQKDDRYMFWAKSKHPMDNYIKNCELRIIEALQFVLAQPIEWQLLEINYGSHSEVRIRSIPRKPRNTQMQAPIQPFVTQYFHEFWNQLFCKYLNFVNTHKKSEWHPLSLRVATYHSAMAAIWPIDILGGGVQVEGVLNEQYEKKVSLPEKIKKAVDYLLNILDGALKDGIISLDDKEIAKIKSNLGWLKSRSSAINILKHLISKNVVRKEDVDAWDFLRNKAAHAADKDCEVTQENINRCNRMMVLFYHLIFNLIGYQGLYTDYGVLGHPMKRYPEDEDQP